MIISQRSRPNRNLSPLPPRRPCRPTFAWTHIPGQTSRIIPLFPPRHSLLPRKPLRLWSLPLTNPLASTHPRMKCHRYPLLSNRRPIPNQDNTTIRIIIRSSTFSTPTPIRSPFIPANVYREHSNKFVFGVSIIPRVLEGRLVSDLAAMFLKI